MTTVSFSELFPEVLAVAPSCPDPTIVRALRNATRELCKEAKCYRYTIENETVQADESEFEFYVPDDTVMVSPIELTINGLPLLPTSIQLLNQDDSDWRTASGAPKEYIRTWDQMGVIRLYPIPEETYTTVGLRGQVALKPTRTATVIDETFLDRFEETIIHGALSKLLMIEGKRWYSPQQGQYHEFKFTDYKESAKRLANSDDMPKRRTVVYGGL